MISHLFVQGSVLAITRFYDDFHLTCGACWALVARLANTTTIHVTTHPGCLVAAVASKKTFMAIESRWTFYKKMQDLEMQKNLKSIFNQFQTHRYYVTLFTS